MVLRTNDFKQVTLESIKEMASRAEEKAKEMEVPIVFAAVDVGGNLMLLHRMEDAFFTSVEIAINKAYTSAAIKITTNEVASLVQPGESLYGLQLTNDCRIVPFGGGIPITIDGQVVGAVGVSGGSVDEDIAIAEYALGL